MPLGTPTGIGSLNDNVDRTTYTLTLDRGIAAKETVVLFVRGIRGGGAGVPPSPTVTGGGVTWDSLGGFSYDTSGTEQEAMYAFRCQPATAQTATSISLAFGVTLLNCVAFAIAVTGADSTPGANGAAAVRQFATFGTANTNATAVTATLAGAVRFSDSAMIACEAHEANELNTTNAGTEIYDVQNSGSSLSQVVAYRQNAGTSIGFSWTSSQPHGGLMVEVTRGLELTGVITPTGALSTLVKKTLSLAGSITPTGTLTTFITKALAVAGSITPTGTLVATRIRHLLRTLVEGTLSLIRRDETTLDLTPTTEDTLTLTELPEEDA